MSLCRVFIEGSDGKFYKDPTIKGQYGRTLWFLCFDDDDPPEIVVQEDPKLMPGELYYKRRAQQILKEAGIDCTVQYCNHGPNTSRMFLDEFWRAYSFTVVLHQRIPVSLLKGYEPKDK